MAMMSWMRRTSRYFLAIVVLTFIASLAYFGATQDRARTQGVATVTVRENGQSATLELSAAAYSRAYRAMLEQYRQLLRERFSEELVRSLRLQDQVIERLVTERLMERRAAAEGIRVSDEELATEITRIAAFHQGAQFSREQYRRVLQRAQLTEGAFEEDLRNDLLRRKLQTLVMDGVKVSEAEVRLAWELRRARVRAAYVGVPTESLLSAVAVAEADLETHLKAQAARYARPERRRALVATLPTASVAPPAVSDAEVEAAYRERLAEFEQPARVRVAHILIRVPTVGGSAAEDAARAKAETALQRVRGGTDFAQVAREVSEDPGTASRGGEVGLVAPGEMTPEFEKAAFGLKTGEVAGPVRTPFGYHVIKAHEVVPGSKKELREVAGTIRARLVEERQLRLLAERADEAQQVLLQAKTADEFAAEARRLGLTVQEIGPLARTDAVEGIGRVAEATEAIFTLPRDGVSRPVRVPAGYALFRLRDAEPAQRPEDVKLGEVRTAVVQAVRRQKAEDAARARAGQLAEAWRRGEDPRPAAKREGLLVGEVGPFSPAEPMTDRDLAPVLGPVALTLGQGEVGGPAAGPKGFYVVKVLARDLPDAAEFDKARAEIERELTAQKRNQLWQRWLQTLRAGAVVDVNRTLLPQP